MKCFFYRMVGYVSYSVRFCLLCITAVAAAGLHCMAGGAVSRISTQSCQSHTDTQYLSRDRCRVNIDTVCRVLCTECLVSCSESMASQPIAVEGQNSVGGKCPDHTLLLLGG